MNIFYLDSDPYQCALSHCDIHLNKMIIESCQLLSTAIRLKCGERCQVTKLGDSKPTSWLRLPSDKIRSGILLNWGVMAVTHKNHPSAMWVRENDANFLWLWQLTLSLDNVRKSCQDKPSHSCVKRMMLDQEFVHHLQDIEGVDPEHHTRPAQAMDPEFRTTDDVVMNYRNYYRHKLSLWRSDPNKRDYANYTNRKQPEWLGE